jgi:Mn-dependent DtxR family transcriptional regulator
LVAVDILKIVEQNPRITPIEISKKLKTSAQYVRNTLRTLTELGLVETPVRGVYILTSLGKQVLFHVTQKDSS